MGGGRWVMVKSGGGGQVGNGEEWWGMLER